MWPEISWILYLISWSAVLVQGEIAAIASSTCPPDLFQCGEEIAPGFQCISQSWVCDGEKDCPDGSDEKHSCPPPKCDPGKFQCKHFLCIPDGWRCDNEEDCLDGSDESPELCKEEEFKCPPDRYLCPGTHYCLHINQLCDGQKNCPDNADEGLHCGSDISGTDICNGTCPVGQECAKTVEGPLCHCGKGRLTNGSKCLDFNECEHDGFCDQLCHNSVRTETDPGYSCSCAPGYQAMNNGSHCKPVNEPPSAPPLLFFTDLDKVRATYINGSNLSPPLEVNKVKGLRAKALDYNFDNQSFCWVQQDNKQVNQLQCAKVVNIKVRWIVNVVYSLATVEQVALDWLTQNWYFTDNDREKIFVCRSNGAICITLINTDLKGPKAIVLDPAQGFMFFSVLGESPKVERSNMDGTGRLPLVTSRRIVRPQTLTLDYINQHLYWADSYLDRLERINYDGTHRKLIMKKMWVENIFGISLFNNRLYASTQKNGSIVSIHRFDNHTWPRAEVVQGLRSPVAVRIYHRVVQPKSKEPHPCATMKPKCEHICVAMTRNGKPAARCMCRAGFVQKTDNWKETRCVSALENGAKSFLIYSNAKLGEVKGIALDATRTYEVMTPIDGLERPVAVDFDVKHQFIYYSDATRFRIGRRKIDGTQRNDKFIHTGINNCEGIAIDWRGNNIYWTDEGLKTISVAKLSNTTIRKTLITDNMSHPRAIVLWPRKGKMFWTDWVQRPSRVNAKIEWAYMDGSNRATLWNRNILWPNGLSLDIISEKLYWCDAYTDRIESFDLQSNKPQTIASGGLVKHPYGLVHWYDQKNRLYFYWTEFTDGFIKRLDYQANKTVIVRNESVPLFEIRVFDNSSQIGSMDCGKETCGYLCLATPRAPVFICPDGLTLAADNCTCEYTSNYTAPKACSEQDFTCRNGACVNSQWVCDGDDDCGDNSDEDNRPGGRCANFTCPDKSLMYKCSNNRCIYRRWMCDGEDDCRTWEDEDKANCNVTECTANHTRCPHTQRCIPNSWLCDHDNDCLDGYDEQNCTYDSCQQDQFRCRNQRCIPREYRCDKDNDCRDNSDEENCKISNCDNATQFVCHTTGKCLHQMFVCDGDDNCGDNSDELNCETSVWTCTHDNEFQCHNGMCVHTQFICDGDNDCGDFSDERNCNTTQACGPGNHRCPGEKCIPGKWVCDGDQDCMDNSDELNCTSAKVDCPLPSRYCVNDTSRCVTVEQLCNYVTDCPDGSDEGPMCAFDLCQDKVCSHNCSRAPDGYVCSCPPLKKIGPDNRTCIDAHPCQNWGICSQNCTELENDYKCSCFEGFELDQDRFTCKPVDPVSTFVIFSNRHEIRRLDVGKRVYVSLVSGLRNTIALDFFYNKSSLNGQGSLVFWTDVVDDKIYKGNMISNSITNIETVVNVGLSTAEGLAVDWIAKRIYWVESNLDQIEVAKFDGTQRTTLIAGEMESPRAIVVDPRVGMLFWTDWDSNNPRIDSCSMSGELRRVVFNVSTIEGAGWPNGLTADYDSNRLYWIDARSDSIHTTKYDGSDHHEVLRGHEFLSHPFAISLFGNYVYWTDWRTNSLVRANKWNGTDIQVIQRTITQPFDIHIFHPRRQPTVSNPCAVNNGGCDKQALCLLTFNRKAACRCPHQMKLSDDNKTCQMDGTFLMFSKNQEIRGVDLDNAYFNVIPALTVPHVHNPLAIDFDAFEQKLYWTDDDIMPGHHGIQSAGLDGKDQNVIVDSGLHHPRGFAVDWISKNMYFTSYTSTGASISVAKLNGAYRTELLNTYSTGITPNMLGKPNSLAVHPVKGKMYWTDLSGSGSISMANLDGSHPQKLFPSFRVKVFGPASLTIDYDNNTLWWVNTESKRDIIMFSDLDGRNAGVFATTGTIGNASAIALFQNKVYFANNGSRGSIHVMDRNNRHQLPMRLRANTPHITALKVYTRKRLNGTNECADKQKRGGCTQLCLPYNEGGKQKRVCKCTAGYKLHANNQTCIGIKSFVMYANETEIRGISLAPDEKNLEALATISRIQHATAIDFDAKSEYIYWVDSKARTISRIKRDLTDRSTLITKGISGVEGIAVDWVAGNIYWTDQGLNIIEVARVDGSHRYVVLHGNMDKPRCIVVDPVRGWMYWSDWGIVPKIERARLDGSQREIFINTSISHPYGLALDYDTDTLYWCDQRKNKIEKVDIKTVQRTVIVTNVTDCMGLTVFQDHVYWTDITEKAGSIMRANKQDGSQQEALRQNLGRYVRDIQFFDQGRQKGSNLCQGGGACQELCFYLGNNTKQCACAHGKVENETKCVSYDSFLMYSEVTSLKTIHMFDTDNLNAPVLPISNTTYMRNVIGLTFDYKTSRVFYSDIQLGDIMSVHYSATGKPRDFKVIVHDVGSAEGLAYDQVFQELYWTSYTNSSISRISISPFRPNAKREKIIQLGPEDHPRAIVIDSCESRMYWTNWNDQQASIQKAYLSGWDVKSIISTNIRVPNGLTIDHKARKLYWSDARLDKIERCDFNGQQRVIVVESMPQHIFGVAVYGDYLYWTDWVLRAVIRANKYTGATKWLKKNIARQPMGIIAVAKDTDDCLKNGCAFENGGCQQRCNTDDHGLVVCSCNEEGMVLLADNKTCGAPTVKCSPNEFMCSDGACISYELICDKQRDCFDGSDEEPRFCKTRVCPEKFFPCWNTHRCVTADKQCNGLNDCGDGSDEYDCICKPSEFQCKSNKHCIQAQYRCDYDKDCPDASDEMGCDKTDCNRFARAGTDVAALVRCANTTACILPAWRCDGYNDCWDNSDEVNCTTKQNNTISVCPGDGWFSCNDTSGCKPLNWKCDGEADCADGSDEKGCEYTCKATQFPCSSGDPTSSFCIPREWTCDGHLDCEDGADENLHCNKTCFDQEFRCNSTGGCIPKTWVCDGEKDCKGGEDEHPEAGCTPVPCGAGEVQCLNHRCIKSQFYCDGDNDCGDGSDEPSTCPTANRTCNKDQFQCRNGRQCILNSKKCDGMLDCVDHSDEDAATCTTPAPPCGSPNKFKCGNGVCINESYTCNRRNDCGDYSDENACGINECEGHHKCQQKCKDKNPGYECSCVSGYRLLNDSHSCEDIDECKETYPCTHYCTNVIGSFKCTCADGYIMGIDKRSCKVGKSAPMPVLIISNRYYIRNITLDGRRIHLLARDLKNAVAIDFDWKEKMIYWSDVMSSGSSINRMSSLNASAPREGLHNSTLRNPDGIAVDTWGGNLYWCDKTTDTIEVSKLNGYYRKVLLRTGLKEPRAIVVHPARGLMFYTDWGDEPHIGRLGMDGSQRSKIITSNLGWPNALTLDYVTDHIFWGDAQMDYIAMADLNGHNIRYIIKDRLPHVFAITCFENYIFWTDWENKSIERAHKFTGLNRTTVAHMIHRPMDLQVYHPYRQKFFGKKHQKNPCQKNGGCGPGMLCLIKPGGTDRVCACPERHYLSANKKTCIANCTSAEYQCKTTFKCIPFWWKCDGRNDCGDMSDEPATCRKYHCRQPGLFQCHDATSQYQCIAPTQICDGTKQCADGSDERNCAAYTCMDSQFKCQSPPYCIPRVHRCNGQKECKDNSDEKSCPAHTCASNQFECLNKRCIPYVWKCDNDNDCGDNSDEPRNCTQSSCREGYLKCNRTGRCVPENWKCDGDKDCGPHDDSDEPVAECKMATCEATYFKCKNNRCIPGRWKCDYDDDCRDGSDELGCSPRNCSESEFACTNGRCILSSWKCDGQWQCEDGSDEKDCNSQQCPEGQFSCGGEFKYCISNTWKCDGELDCTEGKDEAQETCKGKMGNCTSKEFQCLNSMCIPQTWQCDGNSDCFDGSDERTIMCRNHVCQPGYFRCRNDQCVPYMKVCDGVNHCFDGSDEDPQTCKGKRKECRPDEFKCHNTEACVPMQYVCDNYTDCADGSDEKVCKNVTRCTTKVDCSKGLNAKVYCKQYGAYGMCACKSGLKLDHLLQDCEDINECKQFRKCSQRCVNKWGSYTCKCDTGYRMTKGNKCKVIGKKPYLLIGAENELQMAQTIPRGEFKNYYQGKNELRIDAMDVHFNNSVVYMTNYHTRSIISHPLQKDWDKKGNNQKRIKRQAEMNLDIKDLEEPRGIAVDWVSNRIIWTDAGTDKIEMYDIAEQKRRTIIKTNLDQPHAIAFDPESGKIYWTDWGMNAKIESAYLDGSDRKTLVRANLEWPTGLAIDFANRRLYWTDAKLKTVETVTLDGEDRHIAHAFGIKDEAPYRIAVFEDNLYITTYRTHSIFKLDKFGQDNNATLLARGLTRIADIVVVQKHVQKQYGSDVNKCTKKARPCDASAMCVNVPSAKYGYRCLCPNGKTEKYGVCAIPSTVVPPTVCEADFCFHNGTCHRKEGGEKKCICKGGFGGPRCQRELCKDYCLNGGSCHVEMGKPVCTCTSEYTGTRCDIYLCTGYCAHGGYCRVINGQPTCQCRCKYTGDRCKTISTRTCDSFHCANGGTLVKQERRKCQCLKNYTGQHCEKCINFDCGNGTCTYNNSKPVCHCKEGYAVNANGTCQSVCDSYCYNGKCTVHKGKPVCHCNKKYIQEGRCLFEKCTRYCENGNCTYIEQNDTMVCSCPPDYTGKKCETSLKNICHSNPCKNGATCIAVNGKFESCHCAIGYSGKHCHIQLGCDAIACKNGGTCQFQGKVYSCICQVGYEGLTCDSEQPAECRLHCLNGGHCSVCNKEGTAPVCDKCECVPGWAGDRCQHKRTDKRTRGESSSNVAAIVVPIVILLVILVLVITAVYFHKRRHRSQFKHMRMADSGNVEISNPIYMRDYDEDENEGPGEAFTFDPDKPTNFSNPMYDTLYNESTASEIVPPDAEKNQLLKEEAANKARFFEEDAFPPENSYA